MRAFSGCTANPGDFVEARELEYKDASYPATPFTPKSSIGFAQDWSTLKGSADLGVLRLMAAVIHELWMGNDASLLIMPGLSPTCPASG